MAAIEKTSAASPPPRRPARSTLPPDGEVWIDLINPAAEEERAAHAACGKRIPTRDELSEVESTSRHYIEDGAIYLSAPLLYLDEEKRPRMSPVGFIVTPERLVTIRFNDLKAFDIARKSAEKNRPVSGFDAFVRVFDTIVDTEADMLEHIGEELEDIGHSIFTDTRGARRPTDELRSFLRRLGHCGEKLGKLRHSLATLARIAAFVVDNNNHKLGRDLTTRLNAGRDDVDSLTHFQEALSNKSQFLLDAALGFINIDQNDVFKILTVVSVIGVPPTFVASMYGMNFKHMPELDWAWGYPYALALMVASAIVPVIWFKAKKWF